MPGLLADLQHIRLNLITYIGDFSSEAMDVFAQFKFLDRIGELDDKNLLFQIVQKFAGIDLHADAVPNETMGLVFEELIRKFAEASNETAGEHFTPREVISLIVHCLFAGDDEALAKPGVTRSLYDPTAGTGGILSVGEAVAKSINPSASAWEGKVACSGLCPRWRMRTSQCSSRWSTLGLKPCARSACR